MKRIFHKILIFAVIFGVSFPLFAASDPLLDQSTAELERFDASLTLRDRKILKNTPLEDRDHIEPRLQALYDRRAELKTRRDERANIAVLKNDLLKLPGAADVEGAALEKEAQTIAEVVIPAFADLKKSYEMIRPAVFHNLLVNVGLKHQGLCWHWARDLTDRLKKLDLKRFDILWATSRGGTPREHNSVVLVVRGRTLEDGLVLDGWKKSGKPFWIRVPEDKSHPWKLGEYYGG